jgi:putative Ca2+/H+ antiporter (TMEM165/GDT1 family)
VPALERQQRCGRQGRARTRLAECRFRAGGDVEGGRGGRSGGVAVVLARVRREPRGGSGALGVEVARSSGSTGLITDWSDFQSGFSSAFLLIFFSEIGDKTFFIAALLATRKSNLAVFAGTFGALAAMTVISVALGRAFHYLDNFIPSLGAGQFPWDDLAAVVLLVYFGVSTLVDAASMEGSKAEEEKQDAELAIAGVAGDSNVGLQATVAATFALVFVAEWGDKSFFSTIALAAASSPAGVVTGAIAGHGVATVLAVLGGSFLSEFISEKLIAYIGGVLFLVFAATTLVDILK